MEFTCTKGLPQDVPALGQLYDTLTDYLACHTNYPGWRKGIYPTAQDAELGVREGSLFVARVDGQIAGTVILRHTPESAYATVDWHTDLDYSDILVIHTLAVHPDYLGKGIGRQLMEFVLAYAKQMQIKALRLDVYEKNLPAIRLYESFGFQYIGSVDLGFAAYGLEQFKLYQQLLP